MSLLLAPIPSINLSQNYFGPLYEGTNLTLVCSVQFPVFIDYHWSVNIKKDGNTIVNSTSISVHSNYYGADVEFFILDSDTDSGNYTCVVDNIANNDNYFANTVESSLSLTLLILGIVILSSIYNSYLYRPSSS